MQHTILNIDPPCKPKNRYRIAKNFQGRKLSRISRFESHPRKFSPRNFGHAIPTYVTFQNSAKVFSTKWSLSPIRESFLVPSKISRYMVINLVWPIIIIAHTPVSLLKKTVNYKLQNIINWSVLIAQIFPYATDLAVCVNKGPSLHGCPLQLKH